MRPTKQTGKYAGCIIQHAAACMCVDKIRARAHALAGRRERKRFARYRVRTISLPALSSVFPSRSTFFAAPASWRSIFYWRCDFARSSPAFSTPRAGVLLFNLSYNLLLLASPEDSLSLEDSPLPDSPGITELVHFPRHGRCQIASLRPRGREISRSAGLSFLSVRARPNRTTLRSWRARLPFLLANFPAAVPTAGWSVAFRQNARNYRVPHRSLRLHKCPPITPGLLICTLLRDKSQLRRARSLFAIAHGTPYRTAGDGWSQR